MNIQQKIRNSILTLLALVLCTGGMIAQEQQTETETRVIEMVGSDQMLFDVTEIEAKPGETITIRLTTISRIPKEAMAHNVVVLKQDVDIQAFVNASAKAKDNGYIAADREEDVIAATDLAGADETVEVTFTVPEETGDYEYICSFPGHYYAGMKGTLTVKE